MPSLICSTIINGTQEAEKFAEIKKLGDHSKYMQAAYRQLQIIQYSLKRSLHNTYYQTEQHIIERLDKAYKERTGFLDPRQHDAYKAGFITKPTFLIRIKLEFSELLRAGESAKGFNRGQGFNRGRLRREQARVAQELRSCQEATTTATHSHPTQQQALFHVTRH